MKNPLYILTILLPLATELVTASPAAEPEFDDLQDRANGGGGGNRCRINHKYWYWKYPCDQSDRTTQQSRGDQWNAICRYKNWYKTNKGWAHDFDKPPNCHGDWDRRCP
ncbi:hypothetical protein PENANT_c012G03459 [Penicillium antarcticum]|uniref:Uncharacterized protein n=1 Tax=Penicillium antarcticum TaxID=416450 RepID=A0A1V6Q647_9EURO|nr:hypothetical protein PENANT_c012G03459 [Penicillium antarcticum]